MRIFRFRRRNVYTLELVEMEAPTHAKVVLEVSLKSIFLIWAASVMVASILWTRGCS